MTDVTTHVATDVNTAFAIYATQEMAEKAVDVLIENGYAGARIFVLHPKNEDTRDFARRKQTQIPAGVAEAPTANLPLEGTGGFLDMGHEPSAGALPGALREMGVPADWCGEHVAQGKLLLAVKCESWDAFYRAIGILKFTGASDVSWALSPENYRKASA